MNTFPRSSQRGLSLKRILPEAACFKVDDLLIHSCCGDWSEIQAGDLYVALVQADSDGHDFAQEAVDRGAVGIVTERLLAVDLPQFVVDDSRKAMGTICQALAGEPTGWLNTIGVAGSDGKTVTSELIANVVRVAGGAATAATSLWPVGRAWEPGLSFGIDGSARIANWLANAVMDRSSHAILEITAQNLAAQQLHGAAFDILVMTNIRRDESSFERLDTTYQRLQARALDFLKPQGMAVLNADDPNSQRLLDQLQVPALTFGINQAAEVSAKIVERSPHDQTILLSAGHESVAVCIPMIGTQQVYNCLAATCVGLIMGLELPLIARGLESAGQIPGRLEPIHCGQNFHLFVDAGRRSTPVATAIHAVQQHTRGPLWVLASIDPQIPSLEASRLGAILDKTASQIVLAPSSAMASADYEPFHRVLDGVKAPKKFRTMLNRFRAIEWMLDNCPAEGSLLILGNGERPFAVVDETCSLNDRAVCQNWLEERISFAQGRPQECPPAIPFEQFRKKIRK